MAHADADCANRQQAVAANCDIPRPSYRRRVSTLITVVPAGGCATGCYAARSKLCCERREHRGNTYRFYAERVTPAVARLNEAINAERDAVAATLGASITTLADWFDRVYLVREGDPRRNLSAADLQPRWALSGNRHPELARSQVHHRRRPATSLIPMSALGEPAGERTPAIDGLIEIARSMTGKDFAPEARTLERLGLSGMGTPQVRRVVDEGFR